MCSVKSVSQREISPNCYSSSIGSSSVAMEGIKLSGKCFEMSVGSCLWSFVSLTLCWCSSQQTAPPPYCHIVQPRFNAHLFCKQMFVSKSNY